MEYIKQSFVKRIGMFVLCTCILFSTVFMSYSNTMTVKAIDDDFDVFTTLCSMALVVGGVVETVGSGGSLTPVAAGQIALALTISGHELSEYFTDNGDDTYTMSSEFIQLVIDEAAKLDEYEFTDADWYEQWSGTYKVRMNASTIPLRCGSTGNDGVIAYYSYENIMLYPCCYYIVNGNYWLLTKDFVQAAAGIMTHSDCNNVWSVQLPKSERLASFSANVPLFSSRESADNYIATGTGYKDALNYKTSSFFQYGSNYSPTYSGGPVRFSKSVLDGFVDKFQEVNDQIDDVDEKLEELVEYIKGGGNPAEASDGWLKKIYYKLCDILAQLKSIKRWSIVNTIVNGVDAIADWLDLIHDILSDADDGLESAVSTLSAALDDATGLLKTKFPFSVPWDIFFFVTLLAAEPEVPHFEVPIDFDVSALDMQIHYDFVLDFSDYQYLSDISRVILSMTYAVGLMKLTAGIASTKKEE